MQDYFRPNIIPTQLAKFTFMCRTRMVQVGANYKAGIQNPICPVCKSESDTQSHLLTCSKLNDPNTICKEIPVYENLFSNNSKLKMELVLKLRENFKKREKILQL